MEPILKAKLLNSYPTITDISEIRRKLAHLIEQREGCIAVLDDDPTGIQTVHGINVYMDWQAADIEDAVENEKVFYIQTNTRSMVDTECAETDRILTQKLLDAGKKFNKKVTIISRCDSTLRGHYPLETDVIRDTFLKNGFDDFDGEIISPCFFEGGRYTVDDIHYVQQGEYLYPAGQTEFAKDTTFPFESSDLKDYVREKCGENTSVISIPLEIIRKKDTNLIKAILMECSNYRRIIVNAMCYEDLEVFAAALIEAEREGKRFLYRTAASLVRVYAGISHKLPLTTEQFQSIMDGSKKGGIVVVGSHVKKSSDQLARLFNMTKTVAIELDAERLASEKYLGEIKIGRALAKAAINSGKIPVVYTSRKVITANDGSKMSNLLLSTNISQRLCEFIDGLDINPAFFIAKGGITSSDMAVKACKIKKAQVLGQAVPGVPVVVAGEDSRWPGMVYIIFPGNVGDEGDLAAVLSKLMK